MLTPQNLALPQRRVGEFLQIGLLFKEVVSEVPSVALKQITGSTISALSCFIECELNCRQAERYGVLRLLPERTKSLNAQGNAANERGLSALAKTLKSFDALRSDIGSLKHDKLKKKMSQYQDEFRLYLAETEMKTKDVEKIDGVLGECFAALDKGGVAGLVERLQRAAQDLDEMRRRPDRGAIDNIPVWKIGGLIMILGVGIIALIHCGIFGCSLDTRNSYIAALITTALVTLGC